MLTALHIIESGSSELLSSSILCKDRLQAEELDI